MYTITNIITYKDDTKIDSINKGVYIIIYDISTI